MKGIVFAASALGFLAAVYHYSGSSNGNDEGIAFRPSTGEWLQGDAVCEDCTPDRGYSPAGFYQDQDRQMAWREIDLILKGEDGLTPGLPELTAFLAEFHAVEDKRFPIRIRQSGDWLNLLFPVLAEDRVLDLFSRAGFFRAYYEISGLGEPLLSGAMRHDIAGALVGQTEIFQQDGHSLRLVRIGTPACPDCLVFGFDHYGDPGRRYEVTVEVNSEGQARLLEEEQPQP
ncbi:hypothetical protein [Kiloniella sp. b19]|uniref:hypothetical protein n=1 Tax=Kiloniella sp. GXU_MW_B19 TaxID=3141326 RepID=UPI0031DBF648